MLHWNLCKKYDIAAANNWWEHEVEKVVESKNIKILWDFKIQTDKHLPYNTPDITVVEPKQVWLIDVAIPGDSRIELKEQEKLTKYQELKIEIERLGEKTCNRARGGRSSGSCSKTTAIPPEHSRTLPDNN